MFNAVPYMVTWVIVDAHVKSSIIHGWLTSPLTSCQEANRYAEFESSRTFILEVMIWLHTSLISPIVSELTLLWFNKKAGRDSSPTGSIPHLFIIGRHIFLRCSNIQSRFKLVHTATANLDRSFCNGEHLILPDSSGYRGFIPAW